VNAPPPLLLLAQSSSKGFGTWVAPASDALAQGKCAVPCRRIRNCLMESSVLRVTHTNISYRVHGRTRGRCRHINKVGTLPTEVSRYSEVLTWGGTEQTCPLPLFVGDFFFLAVLQMGAANQVGSIATFCRLPAAASGQERAYWMHQFLVLACDNSSFGLLLHSPIQVPPFLHSLAAEFPPSC
jgi:hypothetical protein